jgi:DNA replication and repair protein RecF
VRDEEIGRGVSIIGPHRDDVEFIVDGADVSLYGSRGQQRTAALSMKLAEVEFMSGVIGEPPVLLLDDVMSEFDEERRAQVIEMLDSAAQVFITTTDRADFTPAFLSGATIFGVEAGCLTLSR